MASLEITTKIGCRADCRFCPQKLLIRQYLKEKNRPEYLSFDLFRACIDKVPQEVMIDFSGMCEPWLNPDCTKMVQYAAKKGHKIRVYTTLLGMTEADLEALSGITLHSFVLHIPDLEGNSKISVTGQYLAMLKKLMEVQLTCPSSLSCHGSVHPKVSEILTKQWGSAAGELIDRAGNLEQEEMRHYSAAGSFFCETCGSRFDHNVLLPDGTVLLCCMDYGMRHVLGNLKQSSYEELMRSREIEKIKKNAREPDGDILCRKCSNARSAEEMTEKYLDLSQKLEDIWAGKCWLESNNQKLDSWCKELTDAKEWLEQQNQKILEDYRELNNWCGELSQAKDYLEKRMCEFQDQYEEAAKEKAAAEKNLEEMTEALGNVQGKLEYERGRLRRIMERPVIGRLIRLEHLDL